MEPFKNLFSPKLVSCLRQHLQRHLGMVHGASFDEADGDRFERRILSQLDLLELKERSQLIADHIHDALPEKLIDRRRVLSGMLHPEIGDSSTPASDDEGIRGWGVLPLTLVVAQHDRADFDEAMELLRQMTKRFTAEFAIRYFLLEDQPRAIGILNQWIEDPSEHVRRLVSEGARPRLPWAMQLPQLIQDPSPMMPLLERLKDDESQYVRRSVANHLNDIAKDHPDLVADIAGRWMKDADGNREKLVRHACRSLIKQGHSGALAAFGVSPPKIDLGKLAVSPAAVQFGEGLTIDATIRSTSKQSQHLIIDYCLHLKKANGKLNAKVFKGSKLDLAPDATVVFTKRHTIKPITTRRYYPGTQGVSLRINGQDFGYQSFELLMDEEET